MKHTHSRVTIVVLALLVAALAAAAADAAVIKVSAGDANWSLVPPDGLPKMDPTGIAFRSKSRAWWPVPLPPLANSAWNTLFGRPSVPYMETCGGSDKIGSVQLGTDLFKLRKLTDIAELSYTVYMHSAATMPGTDPNHREYGNSRAIGLEFALDKGVNPTAADWRCYFYLPRTLAANEYNSWVTFYPLIEGSWFNHVLLTGSPFDAKTWDYLKATYPYTLFYGRFGDVAQGEWPIKDPYYEARTLSGKTFNFMVGSRVNSLMGNGEYWKSWYNESGYIGSLTIRFQDEAEATTYDFASLLPIGLSNRAAREPIAGQASSGCRFTVWGKVVDVNSADYCVIDDSSVPGQVKVDDPAYWVYIGLGDYISATGYLDNSTDPPTLKYAQTKFVHR